MTGKATSLAANIKMPTIKQEEKTHNTEDVGVGGRGRAEKPGRER